MKQIAYIFAAAAMLCACNKEQAFEDSKLLSVDFTTSEMDLSTRGTMITSSNLTSKITNVSLYVYNNTIKETGSPEEVTYSESKWKVADFYWNPTKTLDFFARAPKTVSNVTMGVATITNSDSNHLMSFSYEIPNTLTPAQMPDIMVAHKRMASTDSGYPGVTLQLKHALSVVKFETGTSIAPMKIDSLKIKGVNSKGTCTFTDNGSSSIEWTDNTTVTYAYAPSSCNVTLNTVTSITSDDNVFILIPQTPTTSTKVRLTFTPTGGTQKAKECVIPAVKWEAGKVYTFQLNYQEGILSIPADGITVETWTDHTFTGDENKLTLN